MHTFMVTVYLVSEEGVLLLYDNEASQWQPLTGHLGENDYPEEAAIQLAAKQLGCEAALIGERKIMGEHVLLTAPIAMLTEHRNARSDHIFFVFAARLAGPVAEDVHWIDARWFSQEDLKGERVIESVRVCANLALQAAGRNTHD